MRLLVIEDYAPLRKALVQGFTDEGAAVDATGDGEEGLWFARDEAYDVIILDLMLPGKDGMTILRSIRDEGNRNPVLILTAKDQVPDRVTGLDGGADDYMVKPFAFEELLARVRALVRRKYDVKQSVVEVGPLRVDIAARHIQRNGQPVDLTQMEFGILELLVLRVGEVVSRTEITEHLYGFDGEPNSNAIDVHIAQLRKKLDDRNGRGLIQTRRGMGYQLRTDT